MKVNIDSNLIKKKFAIFTLISILTIGQSVTAKEIKFKTNSNSNLKEIVLDVKQNYIITQNTLAENQTPSFGNDDLHLKTIPSENKTIKELAKEKKFFTILNPLRTIRQVQKAIDTDTEKIDKTVNSEVEKADKTIDSKFEKLDGTPFEDIEKINKTVGSGVIHLNSSVSTVVKDVDKTVDTGTEYLYKATDKGFGKLDEILDTGINKTTVQEWLDGDSAARKCFGARPALESHGITIDSSLIYSPFIKTSGGASGEGSGRGYSLFNLGITLDTEKAGLWKGGTFFTLYQRKNGTGISGVNPDGALGDYMGFDGWDYRQMNQISEYWYQQTFFNNKLRMKLGKQDSNTDFGYLNGGWDFMNSAFSVNPTSPLPSYPDCPFGFMLAVSPKTWLTIKDGIYSKFNVPFNITEIEIKTNINKLPGRYLLGAWEVSDSNGMSVASSVDPDDATTSYTNDFNRNYGAYFGFEQMLWKEKKNDDNDMQGLAIFGQFGISPSDKNDMNRYVGGGLHYLGPIPKRDTDILGIAVGSGNFASRLDNVGSDYGSMVGSETVIEAFYRFNVNRWFYLQPDVQFIMNPGGMYKNSVAIGIRSVITF